jgi:hypothetical protein
MYLKFSYRHVSFLYVGTMQFKIYNVMSLNMKSYMEPEL